MGDNKNVSDHRPKEESVFLCVGLVRNGAGRIREEVENLAAAIGPCRALHFLLIESDSDDGTVGELERLSREIENFRFVSLRRLRDELPVRTARLARCRNAYLKEIRENDLYTDVDYVVMADLDGINTELSPESFESCWHRDDWDACFANPDGSYYDIWALRHPLWSPNDCTAQNKFLNEYSSDLEGNLYASVLSRMITIPREAEWIEVDSAFGGLGIYKKAILQAGQYAGVTAQGEEVCEHVPFHAQLKAEGARLFINPRFINAGVTEHARELSFHRRLQRRMKNARRGLVRSLRKRSRKG